MKKKGLIKLLCFFVMDFCITSIVFAATAPATTTPITDSTSYYLGASAPGIPNGAPPVQGVKQTYLVQTSATSPTSATIPTPICPTNYVPQIFVAPAAFSGEIATYSYAPPTYQITSSGASVWPVYGVYANASVTTGGWTVQLLGINNNWQGNFNLLGYLGLKPLPMNGYVIAVTQCCNPNVSSCN